MRCGARLGRAGEHDCGAPGIRPTTVEALLQPAGVKFVGRSSRKAPAMRWMLPGDAGTARRAAHARAADGALWRYAAAVRRHAGTPARSANRIPDAAATLITTTLDDPSGYGRVIVNAYGNVEAIVEHKDCDAEQRSIRIINSGIYCFRADLLWQPFRRDSAQSGHRRILSHRYGGDSYPARTCGPRAAY